MNDVEKEIAELVDELVAKGGPTTGQIKANQDSDKVARLIELGWKPSEKEVSLAEILERVVSLEHSRTISQDAIIDHEKRIKECSVRR